MVSSGDKAVQESAKTSPSPTAFSWVLLESDMTGPWRVSRTSNVTFGEPCTRITSVRFVKTEEPNGVMYRDGSFSTSFSMKKSWTSGPVFVMPHAMNSLRPTIMTGIPGKVAPATFIFVEDR